MGKVIVNKLKGGLGRQEPATDGLSGMVIMGTSTVGGAQVGQVYRLTSVEEAEDLLITEESDVTKGELVWHHIADFFRVNPNGDLRIVIISKTETYADAIEEGIPLLLDASNGEVKMIACCYNGVVQADNTATLAAIAQAQVSATLAAVGSRPISILLDGHKVAFSVDARALNASDVHVVVGQNLYVVNLDPLFVASTVVGLALGVASRSAVNENIGWVGQNNLFGGNLSVAALGGDTIVGQDANLDTADTNGLIALKTYADKAGIYFNDSHSATEITNDYAYLENNRVINKAIRNVRKALLPYVNSPVKVNPQTGQLSPEVAKSFEMVARRSVDGMVNNDEVSGIIVEVDPEQNILSTSELVVTMLVVPTGTARTIRVNIGFSNPF